jgi:transposase
MLGFTVRNAPNLAVVPTYPVDAPNIGLKVWRMFLRHKTRKKDGKDHRYWSVVENRRVGGGRVVQRQVLYLGEINDGQQAAWQRSIEVFTDGETKPQQLTLFAEGPHAPLPNDAVVQIRLSDLALRRPRQWGGCWLSEVLWGQLELDSFWSERLPPSRQGTRWLNVFKTLVFYRLLDPGSEWRLHRHWFQHSAMADLLGEDVDLVQVDKLYRCLDRLLDHKKEFFSFLTTRWQNLFGVKFDVLLYDLTSTYFECSPPEQEGLRQFGYSRDKRFDCVQVVIALIVTPEGFPLAYEVMSGNTADNTTLAAFLDKITAQYGQASRTWIMDRGVPSESTLETMRTAPMPVHYLVGTPKGQLSQLEKAFLDKSWERVREQVEVKLLSQDDELYVLAKSDGRINKDRAIRRRRLKKLWKRLHELSQKKLSRDQLLLKIGAAKKDAGRVYGLVKVNLPKKDQAVTPETFSFSLRKNKLKIARRREGRYLLRTNLQSTDPGELWRYYILLTEIEQAFKELKGDLAIRPIHHQRDDRIEAHIFVAFAAYCLMVTLKHRLRALASGLTPRAVLEKLCTIQMVDVHLPTTDGRHIVLSRYTQPEQDVELLLQRLKLALPPQPPPKITAPTS